jgi:hypothetical protein
MFSCLVNTIKKYLILFLPLSHLVSLMKKELASMQRGNKEQRQQNGPRHPLSDITNAYQPSSMDLDEKKELINARRRAAYLKKKEEATINVQADVQITNGCQPTSVYLDEKKEQIKARRRAPY